MLVLYIVLTGILLIILLRLLNASQRRVSYLRPGWFFVLLNAFYSLPIAILYVFDDNLFLNEFGLYVSKDIIELLIVISIFILFGFLVAEIILLYFIKNSTKYVYKASVYNVRNLQLGSFILLLASIYLYFERWNSVGGVVMMLTMGRGDALYIMQNSLESSFARYDLSLFLSVIFFIPSLICRRKTVLMYIQYGLYLIFFSLILISGARLPILCCIIIIFCLVYYFDKSLIQRYIKKIALFTILLYAVFNAYSYYRDQSWDFISSSNAIEKEVSLVQLIFPSETLTAYSSLSVMKENDVFFYENQFYKLMPNSIRHLFGIGEFKPYSARIQDFRNSRSTLTVPFAVDIYYGFYGNYFFLILYSMGIYLVSELFFVIIQKRKFAFLFMGSFYGVVYYMIRTESVAWVSRILLLLILTSIICLFFGHLFRYKYDSLFCNRS